jgi:hypothetical protein
MKAYVRFMLLTATSVAQQYERKLIVVFPYQHFQNVILLTQTYAAEQ